MPDGLSYVLAADFHMGSAFAYLPMEQSEAMRQRQMASLVEICQSCARQQKELFFIPGDLFDHTQPTQALLRSVQQSFSICPKTRVVIVPGNHDPYIPGGFWDDPQWPSNVVIVKKTGLVYQNKNRRLRVYSAPFQTHSATHPLVDTLSPELDKNWTNGLVIHGDLVKTGAQSLYNPLPVEWLATSGLDFIFLGHRHQCFQQELPPFGTLVAYPGCPMGRGFDELGEKGYLTGILPLGNSQTKNQMAFIPLRHSDFLMATVWLEATEEWTVNEIVRQCLQAVARQRQEGTQKLERCLATILLKGRREEPLPLELLKEQLSPKFFYLKLVDQTQQLPLIDGNIVPTVTGWIQEEFQALKNLSPSEKRRCLGSLDWPEALDMDENIILSAERLVLAAQEGEIQQGDFFE